MKKTAFSAADILVPNDKIDMKKWSVIACDQYTSEPEYWDKTQKNVGDAPSALNLILPEIYLESADVDKIIEKIHTVMKQYIEQNIFTEYKDAMIYVRRTQGNGIVREGIIGKIDLEKYDFNKGSVSEVRATEATVVERIPPRLKIRKGAPLELPHIMILIDDPENTVIEPLGASAGSFRKLYSTELMMDGGSIEGYLLDGETQNKINDALCNLAENDAFNKKYGLDGEPVLLYAMGDGNHSLATAKEYYQQLKASRPEADLSNHPARYALVEIVNLHSPALKFEAIHRLVYNVDCDKLISEMNGTLGLSDNPSEQFFEYICGGESHKVYIGKPSSNLTVGSLQNFLDRYISENNGKIDYIHGSSNVKALAAEKNGIAFILPDMDKADLFPTVIKDGALPRKTFSMGHADDKRFYIEARAIL